MEPHIWDRIQEIYHSAFPVPPGERCDFVARACDFDPDLTKQICSLLKADESSPDFLKAPIFDLGLGIFSRNLTESSDVSDADDRLLGSVIDDRYVVERRLAQGGMARVYLARDLRLESRRVVVKVLLDKSLRNERIVRKFREEKKALAKVDHPGVVYILDDGELPDKNPYLVMQYVAGLTLRELIVAKPEGLPFARAAFIIRGIGSALNAAHRNGIYHRDLKPENIMLQELGPTEEQVKVVDFGIAKVKESLSGPTPMTDSVTMGTVAYMSPEQLRRDRVSAPSDVYSFAVIAYELLTGRRPFLADSEAHLLELQRKGIRVKPTDLRPKLAEDADAIILDGLALEPQARSSAAEFGERLSSVLLADKVSAMPHRTQAPTVEVANAPLLPTKFDSPVLPLDSRLNKQTQESTLEPAKQVRPRRWLMLASAAVLLLLVLAGAYWLIWRNGQLLWTSTNSRSANEPHRTITYSLTVQKARNGVPYNDPFESSGEKAFESGDFFRLNVSSRQAGYMYVFSQGPPEQEGFTIIFPTPAANDGSTRLEQNEDFQTNWNTFGGQTGKERLWIVWSQNPVVPLEIARHEAFKTKGEITDGDAVKSLRDFLSEHAKPEPEITKDPAKQRTTVRASGDLLVKLLELEHR